MATSVTGAEAKQSPHVWVFRTANLPADSGRGLSIHATAATGWLASPIVTGRAVVVPIPTAGVGNGRMGVVFRNGTLFHTFRAMGSDFLRLRVASRPGQVKLPVVNLKLLFPRINLAAFFGALAYAAALLPSHSLAQGAAPSWVVVDVHSGRILMEQNASKRRTVDGFASVATALVSIDWSQRTEVDLGNRTSVPPVVAAPGVSNPMGLQPGDQLSMRDLLYSVVLGADDAACLTLATTVGQDILRRRGQSGQPLDAFVKEMNYLAGMNGMSQTKFTTPHGGSWGRGNSGVTSTIDLARLANYAMGSPGYRFFSMQPDRAIAIDRAGAVFRFRVSNFNRYAGRAGVDGVKAVTRGPSGPGAILTSKRNPEVTPMPDGRTFLYPRRIIAVADGGSDPNGAAWQLLTAGWQEFDQWTTQGRPMTNVKLLNGTTSR